MDEVRRIWFRKRRWDHRKQRLHFDLAMISEARSNARQIRIVVAGMADEFEGTLRRDDVHDLGECSPIQVASGRDPQGSRARDDVARTDRGVPFEGLSKSIQNSNLHATLETGMRETLSKSRLEGISNGTDACPRKNIQQGATDLREKVGVLVSIDVGDRNTRPLESVDLSFGLAFDVALANMATQQGLYE